MRQLDTALIEAQVEIGDVDIFLDNGRYEVSKTPSFVYNHSVTIRPMEPGPVNCVENVGVRIVPTMSFDCWVAAINSRITLEVSLCCTVVPNPVIAARCRAWPFVGHGLRWCVWRAARTLHCVVR